MHIRFVRTTALAAFAVTACLGSALAAQTGNGEWITPVVKDFGRIHPLPDAKLQPEKGETYKIVFDIMSAKVTDGVNAALWHVARAVNLFGNAGVHGDHRKFVAVIHGPATPLLMSAAAFREKEGKENPDLKLIHALKQAGVTLYVCGQAAADNKIAKDDINPEITLTLSALTDLAILQKHGYVLLP